MTIDYVIEQAKYGELSQLGLAKYLKGTDAAELEDAERTIISHINLGLIEIYKRFALRIEETTVTLSENITLYTLSVANVGVYLNALPGDVNSVLAAYDEEGTELALNDETAVNGVNTPGYNTLQVPNPADGTAIVIIYNAAPDKITWVDDLSTVEAPIPPALLEALLHYIGYRAHGSVDGAINAENNTHYMRFDASCNRVLNLGLITTDALTPTSLADKGFK